LLRPVSEPRFDRPLSGVYYQIEGPKGTFITSPSLGTEQLPAGKFGHFGILMTDMPGPRDQHLRLAERDFVLPDAIGTTHVLVATALDDTMMETARTRRLLALGFGLLGMSLVGGVMLLVSVSLTGLRRLPGAIAELHAGGHLDERFAVPSEVGPLVQEIGALVLQNRATVERARSHVGNLAHALRTRLSIMHNALDIGDTVILGRELTEMEQLVQHHLARARAASLSGIAATDVPVTAVADELAHALRMLFADRGVIIVVNGDASIHVRCEREDLTEMLGNLMENACKWGRSLVEVTVREDGPDVVATVTDDGPGLPAEGLQGVRDRGVRLDETTPGSGLGIAIATELAALIRWRSGSGQPGAVWRTDGASEAAAWQAAGRLDTHGLTPTPIHEVALVLDLMRVGSLGHLRTVRARHKSNSRHAGFRA
jgi:signal transduction histidine kinase